MNSMQRERSRRATSRTNGNLSAWPSAYTSLNFSFVDSHLSPESRVGAAAPGELPGGELCSMFRLQLRRLYVLWL